MIIGIDASRANRKIKTGTEWYSYHIIQEIAKIDREDELHLYAPEPFEKGLLNLGPKVSCHVLNWPPRRFWHQARLSWEMWQHPPEVLFVPAHTIPLIHPRKTITTCHDLGFMRFPELYRNYELRYHRWTMHYALTQAEKIIVPSRFTKDEIKQIYHTQGEDIEVIYHGIDHQRYHVINDREEINRRLEHYQLHSPFLLYIGRLEKKKNTIRLIDSFARFKNLRRTEHKLVLVGSPGFGFEEIRQTILNTKMQDEIILPGYINEEDLPYLINGAEIFIFPTLYEGFGLPVLEAMACGRPVITSKTSSLPEITGGAARLVNPLSIDEITQAIDELVSDTALALELSKQGVIQVDKFQWTACAEKTLRVLKR